MGNLDARSGALETSGTSGDPDSILIVGIGALGCLFAARLSAVGVRVRMLGTWQAGLRALQEYGIRLVDTDGSERSFPVQVTSNPSRWAGAPLALVLVKSWQTERAASQLADCLADDGVAVTLQNGLGNLETLAGLLGSNRVALGTTTTGATLLAPGRVRPGGEGEISLADDPQLERLKKVLKVAGFLVETVVDIDALVWGKLVINAAINPLTALLRCPNGELLERPAARTLMAEIANEAAAVAIAQGISLPFSDPVAVAEKVARRTAANHSSMFQDILRGAPTEIDAICGAIVRAGEQHHVPVPANRTLWQLVRAVVEREEPAPEVEALL